MAESSTLYILSSQDSAPSVGKVPTSDANASTSLESSIGWQLIGLGVEDIGVPPSRPSHQDNRGVGHSGAGIHEDGSVDILPYPDKLLWRIKYCLLLNEDSLYTVAPSFKFVFLTSHSMTTYLETQTLASCTFPRITTSR